MDTGIQRLVLKEIDASETASENYRVRVTLTAKERSFTGESSGANNEENRLMLAVQATLEAINSALSKPVKLAIKGINANESFPGLTETLLVVVVSVDDGTGEMVTPGSCRNTGNSLDAAVKATLDATNRVVELYM